MYSTMTILDTWLVYYNLQSFTNELLWVFELCFVNLTVLYLGKFRIDLLRKLLPCALIAMNIFFNKTILLFQQPVPCGDNLAIAFALGLNIITKEQGMHVAAEILYESYIFVIFWLVLLSSHLVFIPFNDTVSLAQQVAFQNIPGVFGFSFCSFFIAANIERYVFNFLIKSYSFDVSNAGASLIFHIIDTIFFSFFVFYSKPVNLQFIICWTLLIKFFAWLISVLTVKILYQIPSKNSQNKNNVLHDFNNIRNFFSSRL